MRGGAISPTLKPRRLGGAVTRAVLSRHRACGSASGGSEGMRGHQVPDMDVHRFFNGQPFPDPFQHQRLLVRKSITLVILPEEELAPAVRPGVHRMVEADPRGHIEAADHPGQFLQPLMRR